MKKSFIVLGLALTLLSGCVFFQKKDVTVAGDHEVVPEKKIGVVTTPDDQNVTNPLAPFMLVTETAEKFFLDSASINLKRYDKRRVEVVGNFNEQKTVFFAQEVSSLGQETQVKQTYENAVMGIKFQFPSVWIVKEDMQLSGQLRIVITPYEGESDTITIERSENNRKQTAQQWLDLDDTFTIKTPLTSTPASIVTYQPSIIGAGQMSAVKATTGTGESVEFFVPRDRYMYILKHTTLNDADKDLYRNAFFDIVSSFEYIPFGKTPSVSKPVATPFPTIAPLVPAPSATTTAPKSDVVVKNLTQKVTAKAFSIAFTIPSNWYWEYNNGGYDMATKPIDVTTPSEIVGRFFKFSKSAIPYSLVSAGEVSGKALTEGSNETSYTICIENGGATYCMSGSAALKGTFKAILASIE